MNTAGTPACDSGARAPVLFTTDMPVRWADLDADGRVNNVQLLRFAEEARMRWASALRLPALAPGLASVVAALQCNYHAPLGYPATVRAELRCTRLGRSSVHLECALHTAENSPATAEVHVADAAVVWVWTDATTGTAHLMPPLLRQRCEAANAAPLTQQP